MRKDCFILRESRGIQYYSCRAFEDIPRLCHGFSTRPGGLPGSGFSLGFSHSAKYLAEQINENRRRFLAALNLENSQLATLHQVHSNRVYIIKDNPGEWNQSEGDALATRTENRALGVQVADCLPVLVADPVKRAIAAVHSGWRGTLSRVLPQAILEMQRAFGSIPSDLLVAVGPGIRACCYEVGSDVAALFESEYQSSGLAAPIAGRPGKYLLDLCSALELQLEVAGVRPENRHDLGACTCCNRERFFSYRAEGPASGRMMAVIGLKD